ncbi:MerR family transcriptional regulator [Adlercreutzia sp. ZJ141]|uniref:MerR family transcriptional regulator n=1 Tax=Adlercreutzia sp. ZJ141 TaxID=2709406 RepID=UPI0013EDA1F2|nr:MerR family transcriptional regulator [Adlercreutzia sp. ZJ141]
MRKRYKIGKISDLMGISSEAIRYYEREGIINPQKDPGSGYRLYTAWDLHILIRTRMFRKYGYSLSETTAALQEEDFDVLLRSLKQKEAELEESIRHQNHILEQLRLDKRLVADCALNINKFRLAYSPTVLFVDAQRSYNILDEKIDLYRQWIDRVPYAASAGIFDYPPKGEGNLRYGLMIETRHLHAERLEEFKRQSEDPDCGVVVIPTQKCLSTFFLSGSDKELCLDMFEPSFRFMEEHGLKLTGSPFARMVHMRKREDGEYSSVYQGWVPCEGVIEYCDPIKRDRDTPSIYLQFAE